MFFAYSYSTYIFVNEPKRGGKMKKLPGILLLTILLALPLSASAGYIGTYDMQVNVINLRAVKVV